jgi:hypothetical protein
MCEGEDGESERETKDQGCRVWTLTFDRTELARDDDFEQMLVRKDCVAMWGPFQDCPNVFYWVPASNGTTAATAAVVVRMKTRW